MTVTVHHGDCREILRGLLPNSAQCCVTSPPYLGLRNYNVDGQIGLEQTPDAYVAQLVDVFRGVHRVLRSDGTVWLNIGDSYANRKPNLSEECLERTTTENRKQCSSMGSFVTGRDIPIGYKPKDLLGIPWRVAFALQADGWYLRSAIVWHKPNPMPESCKDRPTSAYEMVFLLTKRPTYFYDADAIAEKAESFGRQNVNRTRLGAKNDGRSSEMQKATMDFYDSATKNCRNVWTISPKPCKEAHFATMPIDLAERCIKAGSRPGDTILDPFGGAGTTGLVANRLGRDAVLIELNREYCDMAIRRINDASPLFANVA